VPAVDRGRRVGTKSNGKIRDHVGGRSANSFSPAQIGCTAELPTRLGLRCLAGV
jgi:hypothetical protein